MLRLFRILCYITLVVVGTAAILTGILDVSGVCPNLSETGLHCNVRAIEGIGNAAFGIVIMSVFTVVPAALAIAGLIFAVLDLVRWRRRRSSRA